MFTTACVFLVLGVLLSLAFAKLREDMRCTDVNDADRFYGWFYLAKPPTIMVSPKGCSVHVTFRGRSGFAYEDAAYWHSTQLSKRGKKHFTPEEAYKIAQYVQSQFEAAHADHS